MAQSMPETGKRASSKAKGSSLSHREKFTVGSGSQARCMAKGRIHVPMGIKWKGNGNMESWCRAEEQPIPQVFQGF